jgi:hypothetical protein
MSVIHFRAGALKDSRSTLGRITFENGFGTSDIATARSEMVANTLPAFRNTVRRVMGFKPQSWTQVYTNLFQGKEKPIGNRLYHRFSTGIAPKPFPRGFALRTVCRFHIGATVRGCLSQRLQEI